MTAGNAGEEERTLTRIWYRNDILPRSSLLQEMHSLNSASASRGDCTDYCSFNISVKNTFYLHFSSFVTTGKDFDIEINNFGAYCNLHINKNAISALIN